MSRISIDVTPEQHQRLKALAALRGKSIKEYVLESTLGADGMDPALRELEELLDRRIERARVEGTSEMSVADIFRRVLEERGASDPDGSGDRVPPRA